MSLIFNYWQRSECIFPGCDEPPMDERDVCVYHRDVHVSSCGSWLNKEAS